MAASELNGNLWFRGFQETSEDCQHKDGELPGDNIMDSFYHSGELTQFQFSRSVVSDSLRPHGLQHTRLPYPAPTPGACSNSCPSGW